MRNITPCLWFEGNKVEEAVNFYISVFKNSKITSTIRFDADPAHSAHQVVFITFDLNGQKFSAMNGNSVDGFNHAISMACPCGTAPCQRKSWARAAAGDARKTVVVAAARSIVRIFMSA